MVDQVAAAAGSATGRMRTTAGEQEEIRVPVFQRTASYATTCLKCGGPIQPGARILWSSSDQRAKHQVCPKPSPDVGGGEAPRKPHPKSS
jgi:hypothetical protein